MIIDIHTHTFPDHMAERVIDKLSHAAHIIPHTNSTGGELIASMERAGIDLSVILPVATAARQVEKLNSAAASINEQFEGKGLFSFGCMHPEWDNWYDELLRVKNLGLKGIKIHPPYQGVDIDDIRFLRIIERAASLGLVVITHAGLDIGIPGATNSSPKRCRHVVDEIGNFPFILAHMGGWRNWDEVPEYLAETGVYLDTAFSAGHFSPMPDGYWKEEDTRMLDDETFMQLIRVFGSGRILFGTDCPWSDQKEALDHIRKLPLEENEREDILGRNTSKLLKLVIGEGLG